MDKKLPIVDIDLSERELLAMSTKAIQSLENFIKELEISNKNFFTKGLEIFKAEYLKTEVIKRESEARLDGNFKPLKDISKDLLGVLDRVSEQMVKLVNENDGILKKVYDTENFIYKKYKELVAPLELLQKATHVSDAGVSPLVEDDKQLSLFDLFSDNVANKVKPVVEPAVIPPESQAKPKKNPKNPETEEQEDVEEKRKRNRFYDAMLSYFGLRKQEDALNSTKRDKDDSANNGENFVKDTSSFIKSALDNILDLPDILNGVIGGYFGGLTALLAKGLSKSLFALKNVVFGGIGRIGLVGAVLFNDTIRDLLVSGIKRLLGDDSKIASALDSKALGGALMGMGFGGKAGMMIGTMIGGPVGAVIGGVLGIALGGIAGALMAWEGTMDEKMDKLRGALGLNMGSFDAKIEEIKTKKQDAQKQFETETALIDDLNAKIELSLHDKNSVYMQDLQKQLENAQNRKNKAQDMLAVMRMEEERLETDKAIINEKGWIGEIAVATGRMMDKLNNLVVYGISSAFSYFTGTDSTIGSVDELAAIIERKMGDASTWIKEKINWVKEKISYIFTLPEKIINYIGETIQKAADDFNDFIYRNTIGRFTGETKAPVKAGDTALKGFVASEDPSKNTASTSSFFGNNLYTSEAQNANGAGIEKQTKRTFDVPSMLGNSSHSPNGLTDAKTMAQKNGETSPRVKELESRLVEEKERKRAEETTRMAIVNAPTNNRSSTTVQNNTNSSVLMRPTSIDYALRAGGGAW